MAAVHVACRAGQREICEPKLFVHADERPEIRVTRVLPRIVLPGIHAELAGAWNDTKRPAQSAGANVVCANVTWRALAVGRRVAHRRTNDYDIATHLRCPRPAVWLVANSEIDGAVLTKIRVRPPGFRVECGERFAALHEQSLLVAVAPVPQPARAVAGQPGCATRRLLHPNRLTCRGIERLDQAHAIRTVEDAVDHQRSRTKVVREGQFRVESHQLGIDRRSAPGNFQLSDVRGIDLVEGDILRAARIAAVAAPL
jgi:hypothetical protein